MNNLIKEVVPVRYYIFKTKLVGILLLFIFGFNLPISGNEKDKMSYESIHWSVYSKLPFHHDYKRHSGLIGAYSGLINNRLIIAGGLSYPDSLAVKESEWNYNSDAYTISLENPDKLILLPNVLPENLAFGVSITLSDGVLCIGGANEYGCQKDVFLLKISGGGNIINVIKWPSLPVPLANMTGAKVGNNIYIAGGEEEMINPSATKHFFVIDTQNKDKGWKSLDPWPGPPRSFAVSAEQSNGIDDCFYLFSGSNYALNSPLELLSDGYEYNPRLNSWKRLDTAQGPKFPVMGGMAFSSGSNHIIFIEDINEIMTAFNLQQKKPITFLPSELYKRSQESIQFHNDQILNITIHPFDLNKDILFYHTITNTLIKNGEVPLNVPATANVIKSNGRIFIPSWDLGHGEVTFNIIAGEFVLLKRSLGLWSILFIIFYFGVLSWMGWFFSKRQKNTSVYFKGEGKMPWWVVALSIYGTSLSAITYMAIPAKAFATDWSYLVYSLGMITGIPVVILLFIPFYRKLNITSAYEYLELRFNLATRVIASTAFIIFQIGRIAVVLFLPSIAINVITGIDLFLCIVSMGVVSLIYTSIGGIEAVIWTDALQVIILFGGAIIALILLSIGVDHGFSGIISRASVEGKFHSADTNLDLTNPTLITALIATFFATITTYGTDQTMVQRYMTTPSEKLAVKSLLGKVAMAIPGTLLFFFIGTALFVFYKNNPSQLSPTITNEDAIFPWFIFTQMPPFLTGILLSGILAAAMSTVSSSINSAATAYYVDMHFRFGWLKRTNGLKIARFSSVLIGLLGTLSAIIMATVGVVSLWDQFIKILGLIMGSFGGLFLLGLLTRRANGTGAVIGIITSIIVQIWIDQNHIVHGMLYVATSSLTCFIVGYLASLLTPKSKKNVYNLTIWKS